MRILIFVLIWLGSSLHLCGQAPQSYNGSLDNALALASAMNKCVLIEFSTDWCIPCSEITYNKSKDIDSFIQQNFVVINANPESVMIEDYQEEFGLNGFPTLYILTPEGFHLSKIEGIVTSENFFTIAEKALSLYRDDDMMTLLREYEQKKKQKPYLKSLVKRLDGIHYGNMAGLIKNYIQTVPIHEMVEDLSFVIDNLQYANFSMLSMVVEEYKKPGGFFVSGDERLKHENALKNIQFYITEMFEVIIENNDLIGLQSLMELNLKFSEKNFKFDINKQLASKKENDFNLLTFYEINEWKEEYLKLAERIIDRYIFHVKPADLKKIDENNSTDPHETTQVLFQTTNRKLIPEPVEILKDSLSLMIQKYPLSYKASLDLNRIARNCQRFYSLKEFTEELRPKDRAARQEWDNSASKNRRIMSKAGYWSSMSYRYFSLPSYYLSHAEILIELGDTEQTINILENGINTSGSSTPDIEKLISLLGELKGESEEN